MYAVLSLNKTVDVDVYGVTHSVPLSFGIGMIGAIPVFETKDQAESFAAGKFEIAELKTPNGQGQRGDDGLIVGDSAAPDGSA